MSTIYILIVVGQRDNLSALFRQSHMSQSVLRIPVVLTVFLCLTVNPPTSLFIISPSLHPFSPPLHLPMR